MLFGRTNYKFTNKKHPMRGLISSILGAISAGAILLAIQFTVILKGNALHQYGTVGLLAMIFSLVGLGFGIAAMTEQDVYKFFPITGLLLNILSICALGIILYAGVYGL